MKYYILKNRKITVAKDVLEWGEFFEQHENRRVAWNILLDGKTISTVFLGIDHGWHDDDLPVLFETMVFPLPPGIAEIFHKEDNPHLEMCRYHTWQEAEKGHKEILNRYRIRDPLKILILLFYPYIPIMAVRNYLKVKFYFFKTKIFFKKKYITLALTIKRKFSVGVGKMKDLVHRTRPFLSI